MRRQSVSQFVTITARSTYALANDREKQAQLITLQISDILIRRCRVLDFS
jgi:hypothetical protein